MSQEIDLANIEPQIELIKQISIGTTQRVIARAERDARAASERQLRAVQRASDAGTLAAALDKALAFHGRVARNAPSIRLRAPDTGGRPFHFGFSVVTKGARAKQGSTRVNDPLGSSDAAVSPTSRSAPSGRDIQEGSAAKKSEGRRQRASSSEGRHQLYTERETALASAQPLDQASGLDVHGGAAIGLDRTSQPTSATDLDIEGLGRTEGFGPTNARQASHAVSVDDVGLAPSRLPDSIEASGQLYIENSTKLPKLAGHTASFGTIGDAVEERLRFWQLVNESESDKGGHTQSRLVLELPHEASDAERHEIVRRFTDQQFRSRSVPYWVSIHTPTTENDWRNHHAHVVFSERPARRMIDPNTGKEEWDFAITATKNLKCRHTYTHRPYRQNRVRDFNRRDWPKRARSDYANVVNDVMARAGKGRPYDPRSYEDMGLNGSPMKNVSRIIADKTKTRTFVVMDAEWTRKMIDKEIRDAAIRRDATFQALIKTEVLLTEASRSAAHAAKVQGKLPRHLRMGPTMLFGTQLANRITTKVLELERERLVQQFVNEATERTLKHVVEATSPRPKGRGKGRVHDTANAPDSEDLQDLHTAAIQELAAHRLANATTRQKIARRMQDLRKQWNRHDTRPADDPPPAPQPVRASPARLAQPEPVPAATPLTRTQGRAESTPAPQHSARPSQAPDSRNIEQTLRTYETGAVTPTPSQPTVRAAARRLQPLSAISLRLLSAMQETFDMVGDINPENVASAMRQALDAMGAKDAAMRDALRAMERREREARDKAQPGAQSVPQAKPVQSAHTPSEPAQPSQITPSTPHSTRAIQHPPQAPDAQPPTRGPAAPTPPRAPTPNAGEPTIPPRDPMPLGMRIITEPVRPRAPLTSPDRAAPERTVKPDQKQLAARPTPAPVAAPITREQDTPQPSRGLEVTPAGSARLEESSRTQPRPTLASELAALEPGPGRTDSLDVPEPDESKRPVPLPLPTGQPREQMPEDLAARRRRPRRRAVVQKKGRDGFGL